MNELMKYSILDGLIVTYLFRIAMSGTLAIEVIAKKCCKIDAKS